MGKDLAAAKALAEYIETLIELHHDDDPDEQHADPIKGWNRHDTVLMIDTESGRTFSITIEQLP